MNLNNEKILNIKKSTKYWLESILQERISNSLKLELLDEIKNKYWKITNDKNNNYIKIKLTKVFFNLDKRHNLPCSVMEIPYPYCTLLNKKSIVAPGIKKKEFLIIKNADNQIKINYDFIGLTFWILSRFEEINLSANKLDIHRRFKSENSHAIKHNYIDRPIVDEWLQIIRNVISINWPEIKLRENKFNIIPTHDVDCPSKYAFTSKRRFLGRLVKSIYKTKSFSPIKESIKSRFHSGNYLSDLDPYNTFEWLMNQSEKNGYKSNFYFLSKNTNKNYDANYSIKNIQIINLIKSIKMRQHNIGLHLSYDSYIDEERISSEIKEIKNLLKNLDLKQNYLGSRMHFLRWEWPKTANLLSKKIIKYDSTLSYAEVAGFRCGTCFDYQMFNPIKQSLIGIRQYPLIVMDCSLTSPKYQNLGLSDKAFNYAYNLRKRCEEVEGNFICLWHNTQVETDQQKEFYSQLIS